MLPLPRAGEGWGEGADHHAHPRHPLWLTFALLPLALAAQPITPPDTRCSGLADMSPALQALQRDDSQIPALLWVQDGAALWRTATGGAGKSCADCHGDASKTLPGVAAR